MNLKFKIGDKFNVKTKYNNAENRSYKDGIFIIGIVDYKYNIQKISNSEISNLWAEDDIETYFEFDEDYILDKKLRDL